MKLSPPKVTTFWLAFIIGAIAVASTFVVLPILSSYAFFLLLIAFIILLAGVLFKGIYFFV